MQTERALKLLRLFYGKTQEQLSKELEISKSYLSEIESGNKRISLDLIEKYSKIFNFPASQILLFSETLQDGSFSEKVRLKLSKKFLSILEWVAHEKE